MTSMPPNAENSLFHGENQNQTGNETTTADPMVRLEDVGIIRDGRWLVRNIVLDVHKGEIVTLIGPNGSGKSTTARLALGTLTPDEGTVQRISNLRTAYVPQKLTIDWTLPLDVERFMQLTGNLPQGMIEDALAMTGAAHLLRAQVRLLSGGEFQRVLLARAFARKPDLLVLDEPVQGVDFAGEIALYKLIAEIRDTLGCGILLISHDLHVVMAATDRVICLNGHICCSGTPKAVASSPQYRALFGDRAASSLAVYEHHHDHSHALDGSINDADTNAPHDHV